MEELLTVKEAAALLRVGKERVYELIKKGKLQALKLGQYKIPAWYLKEFVDSNIGLDITDLDDPKRIVEQEVN